jgi:acyl-CoA dehydrogenase
VGVVIDERIRELDFDAYLEEVRRFTDEELIPLEASTAAAHAIPDDVVARMARLGLFGITLPREVGGLGWSVAEQVRLTVEFTRAACAFRSRFSTTIGLTSQLLLDHGSDAQRARYLPEMAAGRCVAAFALTEPEAGSDATAIRTTARRTADGGYRLDGHKRFITNGAWADLLVVFARTDDAPRGSAGMSAFLVDGDAPGVERWAAATMTGHEAAPVGEIVLSGVEVPGENLVGGVEGGGLRQALRGINHARMHVAATAVGQATRLLAEMAAHARTRRQFGAPLGDLGAVQEKLGHGYAELAASSALVRDCARRFDEATGSAGGRPIPATEIAAAKYVATEMVGRLADQAVQLVGGEAIAGDHCVGRLWRDVRALRIYEGASELHLRNLGRHVVAHL